MFNRLSNKTIQGCIDSAKKELTKLWQHIQDQEKVNKEEYTASDNKVDNNNDDDKSSSHKKRFSFWASLSCVYCCDGVDGAQEVVGGTGNLDRPQDFFR